MSASQNNMSEQEIWQELVRFTGGNKYAAAGIMGNLQAESNISSNNLQGSYEKSLGHTDESYTQAVDNGTYKNFTSDSAGYGLAQWTYSTRKEGLYNYAKANGESIGSTKMQVAYLEKELSENYPNTLSALKDSKSVKEASDFMITQYERPANQSDSAKDKRAGYGSNYYDKYSGVEASSSGIDLSGTGTGDATSAGLSDVTLEIQPDNIKDVCSQWNAKISSIDLASVKVATVFQPLTSVGVATAYIPSLETAFAQAEALILSISNTITQAAEEQTGVDDTYRNKDGSSGGNSGGNGGYYGGGSSGGSSRRDRNDSGSTDTGGTVVGTTGLPTIDVGTTVDNPSKDITINKEFANTISKLDTESYINFMTALASITKGNLLSYLMDTKNASNLKKVLLDSPNLSADLKKIISTMDENELQVTLQSIITDEAVVPDTSKSIIYAYTESLSSDTNLDILKVSKEVQFFNNVDEIFNTVSTLINKTDLQANTLSIYDGQVDATFSKPSIDFIRVAIDKIAENKKISYEQLLSDKSNENTLKTELSELSKSLAYFRTVNTLGTEASQLLYANIIK